MEDSAPAPRPPSGPRLGALGTAGLVLATPFYLLSLLFLLTFEHRNPEDGMLVGFVMLGEFPLWLGLALFLLAATKRAGLSTGIGVGHWVLFVASALAAFLSFEVMGTNPDWLSVVPALLPPLFILFGFWALGSRAGGDRLRPALGFGAACALLLVLFAIGYVQDEARKAEGRRQYEAALARDAAAFAERIGTETRLDGLLVHLSDEWERQVQALEAIRRLPSRQADAIRLLGGDEPPRGLDRLAEFGLVPDAELCRAYRSRFDRLVEALDPGDELMPFEVARESANLDWLVRGGCDLSAPLRRAAERLRRQPDTGSELAGTFERLAAAAPQPSDVPDALPVAEAPDPR